MLPRTTVNIFSCYEYETDLGTDGGLARHFLPNVLEPWQSRALGPLHNSSVPAVLDSLREDQRVDSIMKDLAIDYAKQMDDMNK